MKTVIGFVVLYTILILLLILIFKIDQLKLKRLLNRIAKQKFDVSPKEWEELIRLSQGYTKVPLSDPEWLSKFINEHENKLDRLPELKIALEKVRNQELGAQKIGRKLRFGCMWFYVVLVAGVLLYCIYLAITTLIMYL